MKVAKIELQSEIPKWRVVAVVLCVLLCVGAPLGAESVSYEYDSRNRLRRAEYESGMVIAYAYDASGNITRKSVAALPLTLAVGVFQNPYLTQFLDVHLVAARSLDPELIQMDIGGRRVPVSLIDASTNLWKGDYEILGSGGVISIAVCATGYVGGEECVQSTLSAGLVSVAEGGTVRSPDDRFGLHIGQKSTKRDGYVLVLPIAASSPSGLPTETRALATLYSKDSVSLPSYRISPADILSEQATLEFSYAGIILPADRNPDAFFVERLGEGPLVSHVDPQEQVVRVQVSELGDFALRLGENGTSRLANPRYLYLAQNVPNPFNPSTTIRFEVETRQNVKVSIFDVRGRRVATLLDATVAPGSTRLIWSGQSQSGAAVTSGVYFARVQAESASRSIRIVLIR